MIWMQKRSTQIRLAIWQSCRFIRMSKYPCPNLENLELFLSFKVLAYYHYVKKLRQRSPCFWNNPDAEELRIKWDLVNKHPLPDLKSLLSQVS